MTNDERDNLLIRIDENVTSLKEGRDDHETRLRELEKTQHRAAGIAAGISIAFGVATQWLFGSK